MARISAVDDADVLYAGLDVARDLREPTDHAVEALRQSLQVAARAGGDSGAQVAVGDLSRELRVAADGGLERLAGVALDLGGIRELPMALLGQLAKAHQRQAEPGPGRDQRRRGQAERDLVDVVQRADEQDQQGAGRRRRRGPRSPSWSP